MTPRKKTADTGNNAKPAKDTVDNQAARPGLSRDSIITAALAIIDRDGYEGLSMRRLGKELGVNPMAVYYHIPNKSALLDALVEMVMKEIDLSLDDRSRDVGERIYTAARAYRDALLKHPSIIQAVANRPPRTAAAMRPVEVLLGIFCDAGFSSEDALASVNILASYVRGHVIREALYWFSLPESDTIDDVNDFADIAGLLTPEEFPNLCQCAECTGFIGFEAEFDRGARALVRGLLETYGKQQEVKKDV
ncbi:MAG: TetR/AcrR family transcriptional regulator C-terminal domain-containing protein [Thermoleophilia bacterium]